VGPVEHPSGTIGTSEHVLASLAATVAWGRKVLVMAYNAESGNRACDAMERMLGTAHGNA
jgi:hypothetical protein